MNNQTQNLIGMQNSSGWDDLSSDLSLSDEDYSQPPLLTRQNAIIDPDMLATGLEEADDFLPFEDIDSEIAVSLYNKLSIQAQCLICLEHMTSAESVEGCNHSFHRDCLV